MERCCGTCEGEVLLNLRRRGAAELAMERYCRTCEGEVLQNLRWRGTVELAKERYCRKKWGHKANWKVSAQGETCLICWWKYCTEFFSCPVYLPDFLPVNYEVLSRRICLLRNGTIRSYFINSIVCFGNHCTYKLAHGVCVYKLYIRMILIAVYVEWIVSMRWLPSPHLGTLPSPHLGTLPSPRLSTFYSCSEQCGRNTPYSFPYE